MNDLNEVIANHILCTPAMYGQSNEVKLDLVQTAYKHEGWSTVILEACIRLCANMDHKVVAALRGQEMDSVMLAIHSIIAEAEPTMSDAPKHSNRQCGTGPKKFDGLMTCGRRWWWRCSNCNSRQEATLPFEQIKQLEVKISLASVDKSVQIDRSPTLHTRKTVALSDSSDDQISVQPNIIDDVSRESHATPGASAAQKKAIQVKRRTSERQRLNNWKLNAARAKTTPAKIPAASKVTVSSIETRPAAELAQGQGSPKALTEAQEQAIIKQNEKFLLRQRMPMVSRPPSLLKARAQHKHNYSTAVAEQLEAFKRKWVGVRGRNRECPEQNDDIERIYELSRTERMNPHERARAKRALAQFLHIHKQSMDIRLKKHRKRRENKAAADSDVSNQPLDLSVIEKSAIDAPSTPVVNDAPPTVTLVPIALPAISVVAPVAQAATDTEAPTVQLPAAVSDQLKKFKSKWQDGPVHGCPGQNDQILEIYELCRVEGMNLHETAQVRRALASFLQIQKDALRMRLRKHRKRRENKAAANTHVSNQSINLSVIEKSAIDAPSAPVVPIVPLSVVAPLARATLTKPPTVPNTVTQHSIDYTQNQKEILEKLSEALRLYVSYLEYRYKTMVNKWNNDCELGINNPKPTRKWDWTDELIALVTAAISCCVRMWEDFPEDTKRKQPLEMCLMNFCQQNMVPLWNEIAPGWMNEKLLLDATRSVHGKYTDTS